MSAGTNRDYGKNGKHNLGGNIRDTGGFHGKKLADGGDPFKSNDDGGGGAYAAREAHEAKQAKEKIQPLVDRDAAEGGTGQMMDKMAKLDARDAAESGMAASVPTPAPAPAADNSGAPPASTATPAPSAMPAQITTLTDAEKKSATKPAAAASDAEEPKKKFRMTGKSKVAQSANAGADAVESAQKKGAAREAAKEAKASGKPISPADADQDSINKALDKKPVSKTLLPTAQRSKAYVTEKPYNILPTSQRNRKYETD